MKSFVGEPAFAERIGVRHFDSFEDKSRGSLHQNSRSHETRYNCGGGCGQGFWKFDILGFRGLKSQKLNNRIHEIVKPEVPKEKGAIILLVRRFGLMPCV
jgi:hypothetical protein